MQLMNHDWKVMLHRRFDFWGFIDGMEGRCVGERLKSG
jgi:hypothetical protein